MMFIIGIISVEFFVWGLVFLWYQVNKFNLKSAMTKQDLCDNGYEDVIVFENEDYDGCIIGVTTNNEAVYSKPLMVEWYMKKNHCSREEALEWIEYNTEGSIGFEGSPIILELDERSTMW